MRALSTSSNSRVKRTKFTLPLTSDTILVRISCGSVVVTRCAECTLLTAVLLRCYFGTSLDYLPLILRNKVHNGDFLNENQSDQAKVNAQPIEGRVNVLSELDTNQDPPSLRRK